MPRRLARLQCCTRSSMGDLDLCWVHDCNFVATGEAYLTTYQVTEKNLLRGMQMTKAQLCHHHVTKAKHLWVEHFGEHMAVVHDVTPVVPRPLEQGEESPRGPLREVAKEGRFSLP